MKLTTESSKKMLSVLMPTHNRADILPVTLKSFENLEIPKEWTVEMIVVVNACTDNTDTVLDEALDKLPFSARYVIEPTAGSSHARNRAIELAAGSIFVFVDDDALVSEQWLVGLTDVFESTPADFVGGPVHLWWHAVERPAWFTTEFDSLLAAKEHGTEIVELTNPSSVITINIAFKREVFEAIGGFRRDLERRGKGTGSYEDVEFNNRALEAGMRLFYAPNAIVKHWVEPSRMSFSAMSRMIYYVGQARVFAKPKLDLYTVSRAFLGYFALVLWHIPGEIFSRIRMSGPKSFGHRRNWVLGVGGLTGLAKRLAGRTHGYKQ